MLNQEFKIFQENYNKFIKSKEFGKNPQEDEKKFEAASALIRGTFKKEFSHKLEELGVSKKLVEVTSEVAENLKNQKSVDIVFPLNKVATIDDKMNTKESKIERVDSLVKNIFEVDEDEDSFHLLVLYFARKDYYKNLLLYKHFSL